MAPKRRHEEEDHQQESHGHEHRAKQTRNDARHVVFTAHLKALNDQFARWVAEQSAQHPADLWTAAAEDYVRHANQLLLDFSDVLDAARAGESLGEEGQPGLAGGPPAPAATPTPTATPGGWFGFANSTTPLFQQAPASSTPATTPLAGANPGPSGLRAFTFGHSSNNSSPAAPPAAPPSPAPASTSTPAHPSHTLTAAPATAPPAATAGAAGTTESQQAEQGGRGAPSTTAAPSAGAPGGADTPQADPAACPSASTAAAGDKSATEIDKPSGAGAAPTPLFAFGGPPAGGAGVFGASGTAGGTGAFGGFNFGGAPGAFSFAGGVAAGAPAGGVTGPEEGDEPEPQKYESEVGVNEEAGQIHFQAKAKLHHFKEGEWQPKGVGQLMIRTPKEASARPFLSFTTEAGRVLYCANIHKGMNIVVMEKNRCSWAAVWAPEAGAEPGMQKIMATLPKGKNSELQDAVKKVQADMA